jgi:VCBS repeat-containing protein
MQQTGNSAKSSFISWAGRFRNIGLVGSAMAVLIGFIEAVAAHASEPSSDNVTAHDHAADISSGVTRSTGHPSSVGGWSEAAAHQLSNNVSSFADVAHQLSNNSPSFADAVHQPSDNSPSFADGAQQLFDNGSSFADAAHQLSNDGFSFDDAANQLPNNDTSSADAAAGHAQDAALSDGVSSVYSNDDNGSGPALANSDSFWFNADDPVHVGVGADDSARAATDSFAAVSDVFADHSPANAEVTFTSAASSSFQYSGPSILDTAPGGASAHEAEAIDAPASIISLANVAANAADLSEIHQPNSIENSVFLVGGGGPKPEATSASAAGAGSGQVLEAWNGDLGTGYTSASAGTAASGSSGSVPGVTSADNGQGLVINVVYDSSVASAPAGFTQTIANVVNFYESQFSTPVTITIDVGFGEIDGQPVAPGALGESQAYMTSVSYSQLEAALVNNANAIGDTAAAASLSAASPVNGQYWIPTADAQALGLAGGGGVDGYAGFTNVPYLAYNVGNNSGTVPGGQYDFFGVVAHEFSEIMGRQLLVGAADFGSSAAYTALDLFHYSSPGVADFSGTTPGYASPDGGYSNLGNFNTNPEGDFGDWASSVGNDSYLAFSGPGQLDSVTASDLTVMNLLGWDPGSSSSGAGSSPPSAPSAPSAPPPSASDPPTIVTALATSGYVTEMSGTGVAANGVLAYAWDSNASASLAVSAVDGSAAAVGAGVAGTYGVLTLNADGSYTYIDDSTAGIRGGAAMDTFSYTLSDSLGSTANANLTVLITNDYYFTGPSNSTIESGRASALLNAGAGGMTAIAGSGNQWLFGGPGDVLVGGTGTDTFMFAPNFGNETIKNFNSNDVIEFPTSLFATNHQALESTYTAGSHTVIYYDATDTITLSHFTAQLHAHNFALV